MKRIKKNDLNSKIGRIDDSQKFFVLSSSSFQKNDVESLSGFFRWMFMSNGLHFDRTIGFIQLCWICDRLSWTWMGDCNGT